LKKGLASGRIRTRKGRKKIKIIREGSEEKKIWRLRKRKKQNFAKKRGRGPARWQKIATLCRGRKYIRDLLQIKRIKGASILGGGRLGKKS